MGNPTETVTISEQLAKAAQNMELARGEAKTTDGQKRVEVDPAFPEANKLATLLLQIVTHPNSFLGLRDTKNFKLHENDKKDDDLAAGAEIAWQLYPDGLFRFGGLSPEYQEKRKHYVQEQLTTDQPIAIDLLTVWIGSIDHEQLQLADYSVIETMLGFAKILQQSKGLKENVTGKIVLRLAADPALTLPPTRAEFTAYAAKMKDLLTEAAQLAQIDTTAIQLELIPLTELLVVNPHSQEYQSANERAIEINQLTTQIVAYWQESQHVFTEYLNEKRILTNSPTLTWDELARGVWQMRSIRHPQQQNLDVDFNFRHSLNDLGQKKLTQLASWQDIPPEYQTKLGWLTPRARADLLSVVTGYRGDKVTFNPASLPDTPELLTEAARLLATQLVTNHHHTLETPLIFQFGPPLTDKPIENSTHLRYFGNLTHDRKQQPWLSPQMMTYTQGAHEDSTNTPTATLSQKSIPNQFGFNLMPETENDGIWLKKNIALHVGKSRIEIPLRYKPQEWLVQLIKSQMTGIQS